MSKIKYLNKLVLLSVLFSISAVVFSWILFEPQLARAGGSGPGGYCSVSNGNSDCDSGKCGTYQNGCEPTSWYCSSPWQYSSSPIRTYTINDGYVTCKVYAQTCPTQCDIYGKYYLSVCDTGACACRLFGGICQFTTSNCPAAEIVQCGPTCNNNFVCEAGETSQDCSSDCGLPAVNGECGTAKDGSYSSPPPYASLCMVGTPSGVSDTGAGWSWTCAGSGGGITPTCTANKPAGSCANPGPGNGQMIGCVFRDKTLTTISGPAPAGASATGFADAFTALPYYDVVAGGLNGLTTNVSARWKGNFNFSGGIYRFQAGSDDGERVYVDGVKVLDSAWIDGRGYTVDPFTVNIPSTGNPHTIIYEYNQGPGSAAYSLSWQPATPPVTTNVTALCPAPGNVLTLNFTLPPNYGYYLVRIYDETTGVGHSSPAIAATSANVTYTWNGATPGDKYSYWTHATLKDGTPYSTEVPAYRSTFVTCAAPQPITVTLTANPVFMTLPANSVQLTWTTTGNPDSCTGSGGSASWPGPKFAGGGSQTISGLTAGSYQFAITCSKSSVADQTATTPPVTVEPALPDLRQLNVIKAGQGSVGSDPSGISCNAGCSSQSAEFEYGSTVTLTAAPAAGRIFTGWGGECQGTSRTNDSNGDGKPDCTVNINGDDITVIANFAVNPSYGEF